MRGVISLLFLVGLAALAAAIVTQLPDIQRYMKMRSM